MDSIKWVVGKFMLYILKTLIKYRDSFESTWVFFKNIAISGVICLQAKILVIFLMRTYWTSLGLEDYTHAYAVNFSILF